MWSTTATFRRFFTDELTRIKKTHNDCILLDLNMGLMSVKTASIKHSELFTIIRPNATSCNVIPVVQGSPLYVSLSSE